MSVRHAICVEISIFCSSCDLFRESTAGSADRAAEQFEAAGWTDDGEGGAFCKDCSDLKESE